MILCLSNKYSSILIINCFRTCIWRWEVMIDYNITFSDKIIENPPFNHGRICRKLMSNNKGGHSSVCLTSTDIKDVWWSGCIAPHILHAVNSWSGWSVSSTAALCTWGKFPRYPLTGRLRGLFGRCGEERGVSSLPKIEPDSLKVQAVA
jgi:hypothetical protein